MGANVKVSFDPPTAAEEGFLLTVDVPTKPVTVTNSFVRVDPAVASVSSGANVLPFTGSTADVLLKTGLWLLAIGGLALVLAHLWRRRGNPA